MSYATARLEWGQNEVTIEPQSSGHRRVWVRVNAPVDEGVAPLVSLLSSVPGLETVDSCEGIHHKTEAYVYFYLGNWQEICQFAFGVIAPAVRKVETASVAVEVFGDSSPMGKISSKAAALPRLIAALEEALVIRRSSGSSDDTARTEPRSLRECPFPL